MAETLGNCHTIIPMPLGEQLTSSIVYIVEILLTIINLYYNLTTKYTDFEIDFENRVLNSKRFARLGYHVQRVDTFDLIQMSIQHNRGSTTNFFWFQKNGRIIRMFYFYPDRQLHKVVDEMLLTNRINKGLPKLKQILIYAGQGSVRFVVRGLH